MATQSKSGRAAREERERMLVLKHKFDHRITTAKFGKQSFDVNDYAGSIQKFKEYLLIMAEVKKAKDVYSLTPSHFDPKTELTEMMMMSHIYFEMARMYDAIPQFHEDTKNCLNQFVRFSANQPYQVVNSELIRKHLKKSRFKNVEDFRAAYQQIFVQSKKCFVVTYCYGEHHPLTQEFRDLKDVLLDYPLGRELVRIYYAYSSIMVTRWENNSLFHLLGQVIFRPLLGLFSKTLLPLILRK
jgi:hypothetical protein